MRLFAQFISVPIGELQVVPNAFSNDAVYHLHQSVTAMA